MLRVMTDYSLTAHTHFLLSLFLFVGFVCEKARGNFPTWPICSEKVFCRDVISYAPKPFYLFLSKHERLFLSFQVIGPDFPNRCSACWYHFIRSFFYSTFPLHVQIDDRYNIGFETSEDCEKNCQ